MGKKAPILIKGENSYCPGCGHGFVDRLISEVLLELEVADKAMCSVDIACSFLCTKSLQVDYIMGPHGRMAAVATAMKKVRPDNIVFGRCGDGAAYAIGLAETMSAAIRNSNITMIVINNTVYGMTGGQMAPTTLIGQVTTSSPYGKDVHENGKPVNVVDLIGKLDIAYLARGTLTTPGEIAKTKEYIKKAFIKQINNEGFSFVEIISPCPTNWGLTPLNSLKRINEEILKVFPIGEYVNRGDV